MKYKKFLIALLVVYILVIIKLTIFRYPIQDTFEIIKNALSGRAGCSLKNLVPFRTISVYLKAWLDKSMSMGIIRTNLIGNIVVFIPYGIIVPWLVKKDKIFVETLISGINLILIIELVQFITRLGSLDIDDVILNTTGILIGYVIYLGIKAIVKKVRKRNEKV